MIVDIDQKLEGIDISYVTDAGQIDIASVPLPNGYYNYVECDEFDPAKIDGLKSFKNKHIKREVAYKFQHHNINEFLSKDIKNIDQDIYSKITKLNIPKPYSVDIETEITDKYGYSNQEKAENRILSISITDENLNTILFEVKNPNKPSFTETDSIYIDEILRNALGQHYEKYDYNYKIRTFDTEVEMLTTFLECVNKYFHVIFGWNFQTYDWCYIFNRCTKLGLDIKRASPVYKSINKTIVLRKIKDKDNIDIKLKLPKHRIIECYMMMFKNSLIYGNLESYSLNYISELILGLNKVMYEGNLRKLYNDDYNKFRAYALIDTILVMLLHKSTNLYNVEFFQSYYTNVPYLQISQNNISEALVYQSLREENVFLLESEKNIPNKRPYLGGFVKTPTRKIVKACAGVDFSSLYPNSMLTQGLSPERKIDSLLVDKTTFKLLNKTEELKWEKYKKQNCTLSPLGRVYDTDPAKGDALYMKIEKGLLAERKVFRKFEDDIYLNIIPVLEKRIKELEHN